MCCVCRSRCAQATRAGRWSTRAAKLSASRTWSRAAVWPWRWRVERLLDSYRATRWRARASCSGCSRPSRACPLGVTLWWVREGEGMPDYLYDMLVVGSGPAGQRAAIQAAKLNKRVAIVERKTVVGGVCINTGTIPSKTLREAVLYLSGYRERGLYGASYTVKQNITMGDLLFRTDHVISHEIDVTRHQLLRNRVELFAAEASFVDPHTVRLNDVLGHGWRDVTTAYVVLATGTAATKDPHIPFDGQRIFISDDILRLERLPRTLAVIGAGVIGCEYASIFAAL